MIFRLNRLVMQTALPQPGRYNRDKVPPQTFAQKYIKQYVDAVVKVHEYGANAIGGVKVNGALLLEYAYEPAMY